VSYPPGMRRVSIVAASVVVLVVACGGSGGDGGSSLGATGAPCYDGSACQSSTCFVRGPSPQGTCVAKPTGCTSCAAACTDAFQGECSLGAKACSSVSGYVTVGCSLAPTATEGQACSFVVGCVKGLFCHVADRVKPGTCEKLPDGCGGQGSCACLGPVTSACRGTAACQVVGDVAVVQCG